MNRIYLTDTYTYRTPVTFREQKLTAEGLYVKTDLSVYYPGGGGQPRDDGKLVIAGEEIRISGVKEEDGSVYYKLDHDQTLAETSGFMKISEEIRLLHARLHTAGHLVASFVYEGAYPELRPVKGHHFPGEGYVEFMREGEDFPEIDPASLQQQLNGAIAENVRETVFINGLSQEELARLPVSKTVELHHLPADLRVVSVGGYKYFPCGGTHVNALKEIGEVLIRKIKRKKDRLKISYGIAGERDI